jgi:hypothetical protein
VVISFVELSPSETNICSASQRMSQHFTVSEGSLPLFIALCHVQKPSHWPHPQPDKSSADPPISILSNLSVRGCAAAVALPSTSLSPPPTFTGLVYSKFDLIKIYFKKVNNSSVNLRPYKLLLTFSKISEDPSLPGCPNQPSCYSEGTMAYALASPA